MLTRSVRYASSVDPRLRTRVAAQRRPQMPVTSLPAPCAAAPTTPLADDAEHEGDIVKGCAFACLFGTLIWVAIGAAVYVL